ncbi:MAG: cell division ATP-binding protein FtsE [Ignavibacteriales bacterium CG12_big_fil_rev_8_21_14_0_65_30_8]|nr:MAG: cell division ATP-binding protein FtsE [Ignavibacteriales bacterium CG12_big_fil_rev_8_21_14_0_65_30_8]
MLSFNHVQYGYNSELIFKDLTFNLLPGDFTFIIGKSGAGKSTLMQMVYMNILPDSGTVDIGEFSSTTIKPRMLPELRKKLGVVFQDFKLLSDRNIYENLSFILESIGTPKRLIKQKINDVLTDVGLIHRRFGMPNELSGGEQQRVGIARAMIKEPILFLADEPTGNLDPETSEEIMELIKNINNRGTSVLITTHDYDMVKKINAKVIKLIDGIAVDYKI